MEHALLRAIDGRRVSREAVPQGRAEGCVAGIELEPALAERAAINRSLALEHAEVIAAWQETLDREVAAVSPGGRTSR